MTRCSLCGASFVAPPRPRGGRPRTRCDDCRTNIGKIDGKRWRQVRAEVLAGDPVCVVVGCVRLATEVDHIVPLSKGGDPYDLGNLQPMCKRHNSSKGSQVSMGARRPGRQLGAPSTVLTAERVIEGANSTTHVYPDGSTYCVTSLRW